MTRSSVSSVIMLSFAFYYFYAECPYAECRYGECHGAMLSTYTNFTGNTRIGWKCSQAPTWQFTTGNNSFIVQALDKLILFSSFCKKQSFKVKTSRANAIKLFCLSFRVGQNKLELLLACFLVSTAFGNQAKVLYTILRVGSSPYSCTLNYTRKKFSVGPRKSY